LGARSKQSVLIIAAIILLLAAGMMQRPLEQSAGNSQLMQSDDLTAKNHPHVALLTTLPGGLRAPLVTYLWIRAENLKNEGKYFDAMQLADVICTFQPHFDGVWMFQSWNMAWNIAGAVQTPEERWLWINNGLSLLRDKAIQYNPHSLRMYKELGWIFYSKLGQQMDRWHLTYQQKWASQMQRLLGAPPPVSIEEAIDAIRLIAAAPLDKNPLRQGKDLIQPDMLKLLLNNQEVSLYAQRLAKRGIQIDETFLDVYNRLTTDDAVADTRLFPPGVEDPDQQALYDLINDHKSAQARRAILAFLRAQLLWNRYRMDPGWMVTMMEKYNAPLDWRQPWPHAIYWITYGLHVARNVDLADISSLNTDRIALGSLDTMAWRGRMTYVHNPEQPDSPQLTFSSDWRYIEPTQREYLDFINEYLKADPMPFAKNPFQSGHINFLIRSIQMLYVQRRYEQAGEYLDWIKRQYNMRGNIWELQLDDFVIDTLTQEGGISPETAVNQITAALQMGMYFLAGGDRQAYLDNVRYARRIYETYHAGGIASQWRLQPLEDVHAKLAVSMIVDPWASGYHLSLIGRRRLYMSLDQAIRVRVYDPLIRIGSLKGEVELAEMDSDQMFPPPAGLEAYRASRGQVDLGPPPEQLFRPSPP